MNEIAGQKTILITGASRGIGKVIAKALTDNGFFVFAGVRSRSDAEKLQQNGGTNLQVVIIDVTKETTIQAAREQIASRVGEAGLYGLVLSGYKDRRVNYFW